VSLALAPALALGACTQEKPRMPGTCIDSGRDGYVRALAAVPGAVRLPGGVAISECLRKVRTDAELQNLGTVVHAVAEELAGRADDGDAQAARQFGYLTAAVSVGAGRSGGISAELARRVETAGTSVRAARGAVARALDEGLAAGAERG
jgi:hypothetical protein